jgi:hypothetical protein
MYLKHHSHLAYCTNVHPGETWEEVFAALARWTLAVKRRVSAGRPYAIGLRLSDQASRQLADPGRLLEFQRWLELNECYVFTLNGFPYGQFHGARVKENVYLPDWTDPRRLEYTRRLFDLLADLVPPGLEGSVSTLPGSFKEFVHGPEQLSLIRANLWECVTHIARVSERTGRALHLGLEPEPFGLLENSLETAEFFDRLREEHPQDPRLDRHLGVTYDTCHFAVEYEDPAAALLRLRNHGIRLSKIQISNALKLAATPENLRRLAAFADDVYLHQVIARRPDGSFARFKDLDLALANPEARDPAAGGEWRVHFHIPLHSQPPPGLAGTSDHIIGVLEILRDQPQLCSHLEMETYTWAVLPEPLKSRDVAEQLADEYAWTLARLAEHGLA